MQSKSNALRYRDFLTKRDYRWLIDEVRTWPNFEAWERLAKLHLYHKSEMKAKISRGFPIINCKNVRMNPKLSLRSFRTNHLVKMYIQKKLDERGTHSVALSDVVQVLHQSVR